MQYHEEFEDESFVGRGFIENGIKEGVWHYFYDSGKIKMESEFRNGLKHGTHKFFGKDGTLLIFSNYQNGVPNGNWEEYYDNGQRKEIGRYEKGRYIPSDFWDENGNQFMKKGSGKKIEIYGSDTLQDVYEQFYDEGKFVKEVKIKGWTFLGFTPEKGSN